MVASGLVDNPHVSHYRLATHLITAFITFGYIFWLALDILYPRTENLKANDNSRLLAKLILPLVMIQIVYGAFVAGLKAGLIYNTFPKMGDTWVPDAVTAMKPMLSNFFENMAGVQFVHRYIAWGLTILIALAWFGMKEQKLTERQHKSTNYLGAMVLLQFTLGVLTLLFAVPIWLGAIHQIGAFFLFAAAIFFYHQTRYSKIIPQS
jgi:cytochrome c oxidase assembly protein subunit 15